MRRYIYLFVSVFTLVMTSCQQEETSNGKTRFLQFSVEKDTSTILVPATRAGELPIALQVIGRAGIVVKETDDWHNWTSTPLELPLDSYATNAFSEGIGIGTAGFDEPYYWGQDEVTVVPKVNQNVNIECRLANVKVTVNYNADVKKYFSKLSYSVGSSSGELVFGKDETRSGYFTMDKLNISLVLTNTGGRSFVFESEPITDVKERQHYRINYTMKANNAIGGVLVTLDPSTKEYNMDIAIPRESNPNVNVWSDLIDVTLPLPDGVVTKECKYRISGMEDWNTVSNVEQVDGKLVTIMIGLIPGVGYDFCFAVSGVNGKVTTATTELQKQLENESFDGWNQSGKTWFPGAAAEAPTENSYWDTDNVGAATMNKNPSIGESNDVYAVGGKSAKLPSQFVGMFGTGKFTAGDIYIGRCMEAYTSPMRACIRFGREFTSRPTQLKGWYKYTHGTSIDRGDHNVEELKNSGDDKCAIYIALTDNGGLIDDNGVKTAYEVNNNKEGSPTRYTVDLSEANKDVIACGSITDEESKGSFGESGNAVWKQFTVDLQYRSLTRKPRYIIVVASASKYGDFSTGSESSAMLIDGFELVYGTPVTTN